MERSREHEPRHALEPLSADLTQEDAADEAIATEILDGENEGPANRGIVPYLKNPLVHLGGAALLALAVLFGVGPSSGSSRDEKDSANWDAHVMELNAIYDRTGSPLLKQVLADGSTDLLGIVKLSDKDKDDATTEEVRNALIRGGAEDVVHAVASAQEIPEIEELDIQLEPSISTGMQDDLLTGDAKFYHLRLYDSCAEDGDIVDVYLNGEIFARVPITHAGATLSIPLGASTNVEIVGFRDGGGGITVACESNQGEYFMRVLSPGEKQPLALVR